MMSISLAIEMWTTVPPPPPLARTTLKSQNLTETTKCCSDKGGYIRKGKVGHGSTSCRNNTYSCSDEGGVWCNAGWLLQSKVARLRQEVTCY